MVAPSVDSIRTAYLDLLKRSITNYHQLGEEASFEKFRIVTHYDVPNAQWRIGRRARPLTLLTKGQLDLVEKAVLMVEEHGVPGDLIEAGVWRGGVIVLMRALLDAYEIKDRKVFAADSFAGIPRNTRVIDDPVDNWRDRWIAPLGEVRRNIERFDLLDERVEFVHGFFSETLKTLAGERFAVVRLDSDSYDSVAISLEQLYPLMPKGGVVIIDDWHLVGCQQAVADYRSQHGIDDAIMVDDGNAFWVKQQDYGEPARP